MDTQTIITYEVIEQVSNKSFVTKSYHEACDWYEKRHMVYETHETISQPTIHTQTRVYVTLRWTHNPKREEA
jgi:hypothetical protein